MYNQNTKRFSFDPEKGIEVLLYIADKTKDIYKILKILYFADKLHLSKYGRFISGDYYIAMKHGPVPSRSYDIIKIARGENPNIYDIDIKELFDVKDNDLIPKRSAKIEYLSETDKECLDMAIEENKNLSFNQLKEKSHDKAFKHTENENDEIYVDLIAESLDNSDMVKEFIKNLY